MAIQNEMRHMMNLPQKEHKSRFAQSKRGFSLVEAMMGATVLTMVLAGCFSGLGQALLMSENVKSYDFASQLLQSEMESVRSLQWDEVDSLGSGSFDQSVYFTNNPMRDIDCQRVLSDKNAWQKEIRLSVSWKDFRGISHSREYVSYYSKEGLSDYYYRAL